MKGGNDKHFVESMVVVVRRVASLRKSTTKRIFCTRSSQACDLELASDSLSNVEAAFVYNLCFVTAVLGGATFIRTRTLLSGGVGAVHCVR